MTMEEARRYCLKLERDRERSWRESAQGRFEASHQSLDRLVDTFEDPSEIAVFSDGGAGEESVIDNCDDVTPEARRDQCHWNARRRIRRAHPEWLEVFDLIVKNGSNRMESICQMTLSRR